jgi:hypothetical protein
MAVEALNGIAEVAEAIGDSCAARGYRGAATRLSNAINNLLWNDALGTYSIPANLNDYSIPATVFCITSRVALGSRVSRAIAALSRIRHPIRFRDSTQKAVMEPNSPNTNGFLLPALSIAGATQVSRELVRDLWGSMTATIE